jgi:hypothetical protein
LDAKPDLEVRCIFAAAPPYSAARQERLTIYAGTHAAKHFLA